jgi:hypothetical protein
MTEHGPMTLNQAGYLADLMRGVERKSKLRYYPRGAESADHPLELVMRAFTREDGAFWPNEADVRDAFVWGSGFMEHWLKVSDLLKAMDNAVNGRDGTDQPMATVELS